MLFEDTQYLVADLLEVFVIVAIEIVSFDLDNDCRATTSLELVRDIALLCRIQDHFTSRQHCWHFVDSARSLHDTTSRESFDHSPVGEPWEFDCVDDWNLEELIDAV